MVVIRFNQLPVFCAEAGQLRVVGFLQRRAPRKGDAENEK
jgi:hypothetical protein